MKTRLKLLAVGAFLLTLSMQSAPATAGRSCPYTELANILSEGACISACQAMGCQNYEYWEDFQVCYCGVNPIFP